MVLTVRRWWILLGLLVLGLGAWLLPPEQATARGRYRQPTMTPEELRYGHAASVLRAATAAWATGRLQQAVTRMGGDSVAIGLLGEAPVGLMPVMSEVVPQLWGQLRAGPTPLRLYVMVVPGPGDAVPGAPLDNLLSSFVVPPDRLDGRTCGVVLRMPWDLFRRRTGPQPRRWLVSQARATLGACGFWKTFGPPGSGVRAWLVRTDYRLAGDAPWASGLRTNPERMSLDEISALADARAPGLRPFLQLARRLAGEPDPAYLLSPVGARCLRGDAAACAEAVQGFRPRRFGTDFTVRAWGVEYDVLGPEANRFLADLARARGPDAFRAFWQSAAPPDSAFRAAFGVEAGAWTAGWMRERYGDYGGGLALHPVAVLGALLLSGAMVLALAREVHGRGMP